MIILQKNTYNKVDLIYKQLRCFKKNKKERTLNLTIKSYGHVFRMRIEKREFREIN